MKKILTSLLLVFAFQTLLANRTDSVYIRPDVKDGDREFRIAYSFDKKHWQPLDYALFSSDYGAWGSQKKMYYPVLSYDGQVYHATFIPDLRIAQVAVTQSADLILWKPQDYPVVDKKKFKDCIEEQKRQAAVNVLRVSWEDFQRLQNKTLLAKQNAAYEAENFVRTGEYLKNDLRNLKVNLNIDWNDSKPISSNLMGIFFEDISYAADGGIYAELVQNRDFEYNSRDRKEWNALTAWRIEGEGTTVSVATDNPIHKNNSHYAVLETKHVGAKFVNEGWDGISLKKGEKYLLSLFLKGKNAVKVSLFADGKILAQSTVKATESWKRQSITLVASASAENAVLAIEPQKEGTLMLDMVSLFPKNTFKGRENGLRKDLAEVIADLKPRFVRFPGGCASHGNGIDNIYHWQATIGELWERQSDFNIWHYHQTRGLGFYEYFQFCEDIGAEPLPVLAAGVPCQNSSIGGNGQQGGIPFEKDLKGGVSPYTSDCKPLTMESYLQELLDLIEWANGDAKTSKLAGMRAKAGHAKPFNLKYLGIGNEDLLGDVFMERYRFLVEGIKRVHPEITIVGTVGPFWEGADYEYGWQEAKDKNLQIVDEHYYNTPGWYYHHRDYYDRYEKTGTKVYLGEWASKGNNVSNALIEAAYLANVERNADVVVMSSYAPLLAKEKHTSWNPDLIYFNNNEVKPTANYYVQRAFGQNAGSQYVYSDVTFDYNVAEKRNVNKGQIAERIDKSVVIDEKTGDLIIKVISLLPVETELKTVDLGDYSDKGKMTQMAAPNSPDRQRAWTTNEQTDVTLSEAVKLPAYSFTVIRLPKKASK